MEAALSAFLDYLSQEQEYSANTVAAYRNDLGQLLAFLEEREAPVTRWSEVSDRLVLGFVRELRNREYASSTVARKVAALKSFFHYLHDKRIVRDDPTIELDSPKVKKRLPKSLTEGQISRLLAAPPRDGTPKTLRDRALLTMLYATGMRVTEVVSLSIGHVNLSERAVYCYSQGDRPRRLPLTEGAYLAIAAYVEQGRPALLRDPDETALFLNHRGERLTRQGLWLIIKVYAKEAGLEEDVTPHTLRHSFAAHKISEGAELREVQRLLGHANVSTTHIYAQMASGQDITR
jgi:integrase/recombinase XerD